MEELLDNKRFMSNSNPININSALVPNHKNSSFQAKLDLKEKHELKSEDGDKKNSERDEETASDELIINLSSEKGKANSESSSECERLVRNFTQKPLCT